MANPNTVLRYIPKRPFQIVKSFRSEREAEALAASLKAEGWETKVTSARGARKPKPQIGYIYEYNVWKREAK